jgi:hypothetical protein
MDSFLRVKIHHPCRSRDDVARYTGFCEGDMSESGTDLRCSLKLFKNFQFLI